MSKLDTPPPIPARLHKVPAVTQATGEYQRREDWLAAFIGECCINDTTARTAHSVLYSAYTQWAQRRGEPFIHNGGDFTEGLIRLGYQHIKPHNKSTWKGIRLAESEPIDS